MRGDRGRVMSESQSRLEARSREYAGHPALAQTGGLYALSEYSIWIIRRILNK